MVLLQIEIVIAAPQPGAAAIFFGCNRWQQIAPCAWPLHEEPLPYERCCPSRSARARPAALCRPRVNGAPGRGQNRCQSLQHPQVGAGDVMAAATSQSRGVRGPQRGRTEAEEAAYAAGPAQQTSEPALGHRRAALFGSRDGSHRIGETNVAERSRVSEGSGARGAGDRSCDENRRQGEGSRA